MSYCRFSSDNWKSDVYIYSSDQGYVCHVATNKVVSWYPPGPNWKLLEYGKLGRWVWLAGYRLHNWMYSHGKRKDINKGHDGETFTTESAAHMSGILNMLVAAGYHVPEYAQDGIYDEAMVEGLDKEPT